jgi:hypothetical protein
MDGFGYFLDWLLHVLVEDFYEAFYMVQPSPCRVCCRVVGGLVGMTVVTPCHFLLLTIILLFLLLSAST